MMTVSIDKTTLDVQENTKMTLLEAINLVESNGLKTTEIITKIVIDGKKYNLETIGDLLDSELSTLPNVSLEIQTNHEIAFEALKDSNDYIDNLSAKISLVVEAYNNNETEIANQNFSELIDLIDLFIQLISKVHKTVRSFNPDFFKNNETIRNLEIHLLSILKALIPAKEKNDIIMLSDLLEYELADNLAQWKIQAIPLMLESKNI